MNTAKKIPTNECLDEWITRLSAEELPAFAHTARSLAFVSRDEDSSADDLSNVILHDSAMTARILRIANSVHYNPTGDPIETVSYATVVLGFEQVRNLALTISMIDTVLDVEPQKQIQQEMVCAYHSAVQAQRLVSDSDPSRLEAVYIGALLHRLGQIMFWCFPFGRGEALLEAYSQFEDRQPAERKVLGFNLDDLTNALVSEWNLSAMLERAMQSEEAVPKEGNAISIGSGIADNIHKGWESSTVKSIIDEAGTHLSVSSAEARNHVYESARVATEGLESFGFPQTHNLLPPENIEESTEENPQQDSTELELRILRQLTHMLGENMDLNRVLMAVLEGIYRVLDMDQVVFAVVSPKSNKLKAKLMIGKRRESIIRSENKDFTTGEYLKQLMASGESSYVNSKKLKEFSKEAIDPLIKQLGAQEFFINPITINNRSIGVIYADRYARQTPFTKANFKSFCHLAEHSTLAFKILSR